MFAENNSSVKTPYLIQRGTIERPLDNYKDVRLSKAVDLDYMGSAEFEFGALPKSFRAMEAMADNAKLTVMTVPKGDTNQNTLFVFHFFNDEELEQYKGYLIELRNSARPKSFSLKERTSFNIERSKYEQKIDFWWDIRNHVMWSFDKDFMDNIHNLVANSLNYMNSATAL